MTRGGADGDRGVVMLSFRVPRALKLRLESVAAATGESMQDLARRGLECELDVLEELLDERRAAFARLAAEENSRRRAKRAERVAELHVGPRTP